MEVPQLYFVELEPGVMLEHWPICVVKLRLGAFHRDKVVDVIDKMHSALKFIPHDQRRLTIAGTFLEREWFIQDVVPEGATLSLVPGFHIEVNVGDGMFFKDVEPSDTIDTIKAFFAVIPPERQLVFYGSVLLEDGRTIADYNIPPGAVLRIEVIRSPRLMEYPVCC